MGFRKIAPYEYSHLWELPPVKITPQNFSPEKIPPPGKITPNEIPSPLINHTNERKNKIIIFCLEKSCAIQHPYQNNQGPLWYTDDLTENTGLRYFLYRMKKIKKSNESENCQVAFICQLYKSRRTKTRQSNYKIWHILCETTKWQVKHAFRLVNFKKSKQ